MGVSLRVVAETVPSCVSRRSFEIIKLLSSRLDWGRFQSQQHRFGWCWQALPRILHQHPGCCHRTGAAGRRAGL